MPDYQAYVIGQDGNFIDFKSIEAKDDAEALAKAKHLLDGHDLEIWHLDRKVGVLHHD